MKSAGFFAIGVIILGAGAFAWISRDKAGGVAASIEQAVAGNDAASTIASWYTEPRPPFNVREEYIPSAYADRVAQCVVNGLDDPPGDSAPAEIRQLAATWRDYLPIIRDVQDNNTGQYTGAQLGRAEGVRGMINMGTRMCAAELIPSGVLEQERQAYLSRVLAENRAEAAERGAARDAAAREQRQSEWEARQTCESAREGQRWYSEYPARDTSGRSLQRFEAYLAAYCNGNAPAPAPAPSANDIEAAKQRGAAASENASNGGRMTREEVRAHERTIRDRATCEAQQGVWNAFEGRCYLPNRN